MDPWKWDTWQKTPPPIWKTQKLAALEMEIASFVKGWGCNKGMLAWKEE